MRLDLLATLLMSVACVAIFVFGLMLQRRREYVTLRAQGMPARQVGALVLGEAGLVAVGGLVVGAVVGIAHGVRCSSTSCGRCSCWNHG